MKKIGPTIVFLMIIAAIIWFGSSNGTKDSGETGAEPPVPSVESPPVAQNGNGKAEEQPSEEDGQMVAFEKRIGRKFTEEEKRLRPPEMGWTAWGQFVDVHRMQSFKNGPVNFLGLVVTPEGEPISGVTMTAEIRQYIGLIAEKLISGDSTKLKQIPLVTDESGRFSISGESGTNLQIFDFTKEGFEFVGEKKYWGASFNPHVSNHHKPDPANPEVFTMRKIE